MSIVHELAAAKQYFVSTLFDNFAVKFASGAVAAMWVQLYDQNGSLVNFVVFAYVVDFVL